MPVMYMWCAQTMKERNAEDKERADHRLVSVERLARVIRDDLRDDADARQDEHVDLRMREEPEEVLPEQRAAAAGPMRGMAHGSRTSISPVGMKKLEPNARSISCMTPAASSGGNASSSRKAVTNCAQTKNGRRIQVMPGARS